MQAIAENALMFALLYPSGEEIVLVLTVVTRNRRLSRGRDIRFRHRKKALILSLQSPYELAIQMPAISLERFPAVRYGQELLRDETNDAQKPYGFGSSLHADLGVNPHGRRTGKTHTSQQAGV